MTAYEELCEGSYHMARAVGIAHAEFFVGMKDEFWARFCAENNVGSPRKLGARIVTQAATLLVVDPTDPTIRVPASALAIWQMDVNNFLIFPIAYAAAAN